MIRLLSGINQERKERISRGIHSFPAETIKSYEEQYRGLLQKGREENKKMKYRYARQKEQALLNRMETYSGGHLLFAQNFDVPFDDNISERDLRKAELLQG